MNGNACQKTVAGAIPGCATVPAVEYMSHKFLHWNDRCSEASPYCTERTRVLAPIAAAFFATGEPGVIAAARGNNHIFVVRCWELAMSVVYGPVALHESYLDGQGRPTAECLAKFPDVASGIAQARAALRAFLGVY